MWMSAISPGALGQRTETDLGAHSYNSSLIHLLEVIVTYLTVRHIKGDAWLPTHPFSR